MANTIPKRLDETIPGGRYTSTAGNLINAWGDAINETDTKKDDADQENAAAETEKVTAEADSSSNEPVELEVNKAVAEKINAPKTKATK